MPTLTSKPDFGPPVKVQTAPPRAQAMVVCEHASRFIPKDLAGLGLDPELRDSHIAWDPGALGVAQALCRNLQAPLVTGTVSRLVYDLNRPPDAISAVPQVSEVHSIPGNAALSAHARRDRVHRLYLPFRRTLDHEIARRQLTLRLLVTVHSFTPVYNDCPRAVELGLLHGRDARFAKAMLAHTPESCAFNTQLNAPYSADDGVAHTLDLHGCDNGLLNVMLEIRNDLIATEADQKAWGDMLAPWITKTLRSFDADWAQGSEGQA